MLLENLQLLTAIGVIGGCVFLLLFYWKAVPRLVERDSRKRGVKTRDEYYEEVKSDNRWHNLLKTAGLWIMGGCLLFLAFFTVILDQMGVDIGQNWYILIVGATAIFVVLLLQALNRGINWGRRYVPVAMTISMSPDGRKLALKETLLTETQEIGRFKRTDREKYFGEMSLQFCPHFRDILLKNRDGNGENIDWKKLTHKDIKWRHDELETYHDLEEWKPDEFGWEEFCKEHCPTDQCLFSKTRRDLLADNQWRMYEVRGKQFDPFSMWVYIMHTDFEKEFTREDMQFAIGGIIWPVSGARISCTLVEVNHTIDGKHASGKPELVPCPIFLVTESAYTRQLIHKGITPEYMSASQMYKLLKDRPIPGTLDAAIHVRKVDAQIQRVLSNQVADRNEMRQIGTNVIENLLLTGERTTEIKKNPLFWFILIIAAALLIIGGYIVFSGRLVGGAAANATQGAF